MELWLSDEQIERYAAAYQQEVVAFPFYQELFGRGKPGYTILLPTFEDYIESHESYRYPVRVAW